MYYFVRNRHASLFALFCFHVTDFNDHTSRNYSSLRPARRLVKDINFINVSDTIFLIGKVWKGSKKEFLPFLYHILCFGEIFGSKSAFLSLSFFLFLLLPLPVMSRRHSFPGDARSILGNTSCQFPMLYKVSPYEDRRPARHTLFGRKSILLREFLYTQVRGKMENGDSAKKIAFCFSSFLPPIISQQILIMKEISLTSAVTMNVIYVNLKIQMGLNYQTDSCFSALAM